MKVMWSQARKITAAQSWMRVDDYRSIAKARVKAPGAPWGPWRCLAFGQGVSTVPDPITGEGVLALVKTR